MRTAEQVNEALIAMYIDGRAKTKEDDIRILKEWGGEIAEHMRVLSGLKWSAGESGIITREDVEITISNL